MDSVENDGSDELFAIIGGNACSVFDEDSPLISDRDLLEKTLMMFLASSFSHSFVARLFGTLKTSSFGRFDSRVMGPSNRLLNSWAFARSDAIVLGGGFRRSRAVVVSGLLFDGWFRSTDCEVCNSLVVAVAVVGLKCTGHESTRCSSLMIASSLPPGMLSAASAETFCIVSAVDG